MTFNGFTKEDFDCFLIDGLVPRMQAIRERIQPKFQAISDEIIHDIAVQTGNEMFLHIARHARRKVNPPADTWMSFCHNKRGYKQHPHFQIGLYDDRVFIWFALIYEAPNKSAIASRLLKQQKKLFKDLPKSLSLSMDHMNKDYTPLAKLTARDITLALERFRDVKSAELLIGRVIMADDPILSDATRFLELARETFEQLMLIYRVSMSST